MTPTDRQARLDALRNAHHGRRAHYEDDPQCGCGQCNERFLLAELERVEGERDEWAKKRLESIDSACAAGPGGCHADDLEETAQHAVADRDAALEQVRVLRHALVILHPKKDVWRTPTDEQAEQIEAALAALKEKP